MISRISDDYNSISDECYERLAEALNKDNKKLFSVVNSDAKANEIKQRLASNGYNVSVKKDNSLYKIFYSSEVPKIKIQAGVLDCFSKIGDNAFKALQKIAGIYDYDFDDGSIWKVEQFEDGEYLVKEINSDDENDVVRIKTASDSNAIDDDAFVRIMKMFYGKYADEIISDALENQGLKNELEKVLKGKLYNEISSIVTENNLDSSPDLIDDLHKKALTNKTVSSKIDLADFVKVESSQRISGR